MSQNYTSISDPITEAERRAYRAGRYSFTAPPVCVAGWNEDAWIRYVRPRLRLLPEDAPPGLAPVA